MQKQTYVLSSSERVQEEEGSAVYIENEYIRTDLHLFLTPTRERMQRKTGETLYTLTGAKLI